MLAMTALLFISNNLVGAAAPDDPIATLRAHPAYQEESTLIRQRLIN